MNERTRLDWVESMGGPLILVPDTVLEEWTGVLDHLDGLAPEELDELGFGGDYSLACAVDGYAGTVPVGGGSALVLADHPSPTAYLPSHGCLLRWMGAESEQQILDHVDAALAGTVWLEQVRWRTDGDAVLFDSAVDGEDARLGVWPDGGPIDFARVPLAAGEYLVRVANVVNGIHGPDFVLVDLGRIGP